jgi:signal transduction histidine kinase
MSSESRIAPGTTTRRSRQAVSALRGEQPPTLAQLGAMVEDFRRDTGAEATLRVDGTSRPLPADASLALFRGAQEALTTSPGTRPAPPPPSP